MSFRLFPRTRPGRPTWAVGSEVEGPPRAGPPPVALRAGAPARAPVGGDRTGGRTKLCSTACSQRSTPAPAGKRNRSLACRCAISRGCCRYRKLEHGLFVVFWALAPCSDAVVHDAFIAGWLGRMAGHLMMSGAPSVPPCHAGNRQSFAQHLGARVAQCTGRDRMLQEYRSW